MVHGKGRVQGRAAFFAERKVEFEFAGLEIQQVIAARALHAQKPFEPHETDERRFQVAIRRARPEACAAESGREDDAEGQIAIQRAETQQVQPGETETAGRDAAPVRPHLGRLIPDRGTERHRPIAHADPFIHRRVRIGSELIAAIPEEIAEIVQLRETRHVTDITLKIILAREGRNGLGLLYEAAQFVADQHEQDEQRRDCPPDMYS